MAKVITYTPKEAAALSGVTSDIQREWRRRKLMPFIVSRQGSREWKNFDLREVCALTIMRSLSDFEVPLATARTIAEASADYVVVFILKLLDLKESCPGLVKNWEVQQFVVIGSDKVPQFSDDLEKLLLRQHSPATTSLDLAKIADLIVRRATGPFVVEP
jgi:MerR HTH family regulatory protein